MICLINVKFQFKVKATKIRVLDECGNSIDRQGELTGDKHSVIVALNRLKRVLASTV